MKKIILIVSLLVCVCVICSCAHEHEEAEEYKNDENYHWFPCVDEDCDVAFNKVSHTWGVGEITTKPTASQDGVMSYLCTVCKRLKQESVKYNPNPTVSSSQWQSAFDLAKYNNVKVILIEEIEFEGSVSKQEYKIQANQDVVYMTVTSYADGEETQYVGKYQEGSYLWTFTDKNQKKEDIEPTISRDFMNPTAVLTDNGFDKLKDLFEKFVYNDSTGYYEAENVTLEKFGYGYESIAVKMGDGKISEIKAVSTHNPAINISVSYLDYNAEKPLPPTKDEKK